MASRPPQKPMVAGRRAWCGHRRNLGAIAADVATADSVRADYRGASVAPIVPRTLRREPAPWLPDLVLEARVVVLLVLDGLGWDAVQTHPTVLSTIHGMEGGPVTTVVPSTTAAALTSIT